MLFAKQCFLGTRSVFCRLIQPKAGCSNKLLQLGLWGYNSLGGYEAAMVESNIMNIIHHVFSILLKYAYTFNIIYDIINSCLTNHSSPNCRHDAKLSCVFQTNRRVGVHTLIASPDQLSLAIVSIAQPPGQQWRVFTISNLVLEELKHVGKLRMPPTIGYLPNSGIEDKL